MKLIPELQLDPSRLRVQLDELSQLLADPRRELDEQQEILPFFKERVDLSAFIGVVAALGRMDGLSHEFDLGGLFRADLLVRSRGRHLLVEFEDAKATSIFRRASRSEPEWSPRFEHGFAQAIDWMYYLDDQRRTDRFRDIFGEDPAFSFLLVIGRDTFLDDAGRRRLRWRSREVTICRSELLCMTFDELHRQLRLRLDDMEAFASLYAGSLG